MIKDELLILITLARINTIMLITIAMTIRTMIKYSPGGHIKFGSFVVLFVLFWARTDN